ncbi:hypothetical protein HL653_15535 [Sphingomonas sp. AP4-R1]|uniref:hypothetical protein n=1 Tax=Sphingomonas sp. AP4-R1 TaxID=2735134 RepID=UPI001493945B|nr:hypothetical protein [Sphingomonas sp. AP4-R1]QJU58987.1 hypothetical protein HL653_15535 [Sphingomonas sp. AP4-R1]
MMAKPPEAPHHSDIDGVHEDAETSEATRKPHPNPGGALNQADEESKGRPDGGRQSND